MGLMPTGSKAAESTDDHDGFRTELVNLIDRRHERLRLAGLSDGQALAMQWGPRIVSTTNRPAVSTRLMASLPYLRHVCALSAEDTVQRCCANPHWQHFSNKSLPARTALRRAERQPSVEQGARTTDARDHECRNHPAPELRSPLVLVDRGYRGVRASAGIKLLKRSQVVEPMIGHMTTCGLLHRNCLQGAVGDSTRLS
jgi:hypothetical protein